jgi:hypothetical protein
VVGGNRAPTCWDSALKNLTMMVKTIYNGWRLEDLWLDQ